MGGIGNWTLGKMKAGLVRAGQTLIGRNFKTLIVAILTEVDTLTIRIVMGWSSIIFAFLMLASEMPFTKDAYGLMEAIAPQWLWSLTFMGYGLPTVYLVYSKKHRAKMNLVFNFYGFLLWGFCLVSMIVALGYISPIMAPYLIVLPLMAWSIVRTAPPRRIR
jgi:hypothetical protein